VPKKDAEFALGRAVMGDEIGGNQTYHDRSLPFNLGKQHPSKVLERHFPHWFGASNSGSQASIYGYRRVVGFALTGPIGNGIKLKRNHHPALMRIL
jgi:hypothetical protein